MTPKERAAMQQALDTLNEMEYFVDSPEEVHTSRKNIEEAITALREALDHSGEANEMVQEPVKKCAKRMKRLFERDGYYSYAQMINLEAEQAEQQEPFGWYSDKGGFNECGEGVPLYTAPPQREWVEPSDEQIEEAYLEGDWPNGFARAVLKLAKELNT